MRAELRLTARSSRELEPDAVRAAATPLDAPARADLLDQEEAHAARDLRVQVLNLGSTRASRVRHRHPQHFAATADAQLDLLRRAGPGVEHRVGDELGREQVQV